MASPRSAIDGSPQAPVVVRNRSAPYRLTVVVLVIGLLVIGVGSWASHTANQRNNLRLLALQTREAGSTLSAVVPDIQTPLASAAELAAATDANTARFAQFIAPDVGKGRLFVSASLWRRVGDQVTLLTTVGPGPLLARSPALADLDLVRAATSHQLTVFGLLGGSDPRLGYGYSGATGSIVVYAESRLPPGKVAPVERGSAFSDLEFALYLGSSTRPSALLEASTLSLPLPDPTVTTIVPFGSSALTFSATSTGQLGGALIADLWWLITLVGVALTLGAALLTERLVRGRVAAQGLARENARLYAQQRGVAETLQHALLPAELPTIPGVEFAVRYVPGTEGLEIGGDWYDVLELAEGRFLFVVGDVSGRGLRAATIMASIRFAIRAYALEGDSPAMIFDKLAEVVDISRDRHFATAICGLVDTRKGEVTFVNAGHPLILRRDLSGTGFIPTPVGPPIGVPITHPYASTTVTIEPGAILLGFTDGLIERRGEHLDEGLGRLRALVADAPEEVILDGLLGDVVAALTPAGPTDDIALLGMKWSN